MFNYETDLLSLLPAYLQNYKELSGIMHAESPEFSNIKVIHNTLIDNRYITSCDDKGITRYEKILSITPKGDDTLDDRIFRCLTKWNMTLPYNYAFLAKKLTELCGTEYQLQLNINQQSISVKLGLTMKNQYEAVKKLLYEIVPCNLLLDVSLLYNQNITIGRYTHKQLSAFTHMQLRENKMN